MTILLLACLLLQDPDLQRATDLVQQLDHTELTKRDEAERELKRLAPTNDAIDKLVDEALKSDSPEKKSRAQNVKSVRAAARVIPDPEQFMERIQSPNAGVRNWAIERLRRIGGPAAPLAADLLRSPDQMVRMTALKVIGQSGDAKYADAVRPLLEDPTVAPNAMQCLVEIKDDTLRPRLKTLTLTGDIHLGNPVSALVAFRNPEDLPFLESVLKGDNRNFADWLMVAIRPWKEAKVALAAPLNALAKEGNQHAMLLAAENPAPGLAASLKEACRRDENMPAAAFALASMGDRDAIPFLLHLVKYEKLALAGIWGLGRLKATEAIWLFRKIAARPEPAKVRHFVYMARALGEIGGDDAESLLLGLAQDGSSEIAYEACVALGKLKSKPAIEKLLPLLHDAIGFQRLVIPAEAAPAEIFQMTNGTEVRSWSQVREAVVGALESITGETMKGTFEEKLAAWKKWKAK